MIKFKLFLRFDKEEKWLECMSEQGWLLSKKSLFYFFHKIEPETKTIRIDYRQFESAQDFQDYCTLFEDSGWKHITGTKSSGTQYFLRIKEDSTKDIFSDSLSKAGRYKRLSNIWLSCAAAFIFLLLSMKAGNWININILSSPKKWYLTPGLWELEGISFLWAFLFETPFALIRGIGWIIPVFAILICIGYAIKSHLIYHSEVK